MKQTYRIAITGLFIALGLIIPSVFHSFGMIGGQIFLPLHLSVILCGFICGAPFGLLCGIITVVLSSLLNGMPPMGPIAYGMMIELAAYGFISGLLFKKTNNVFVSLVAAQLVGRVILAIVNFLMFTVGVSQNAFVLTAFITSTTVTALPGLAIQWILIPAIVLLLQKNRLIAQKTA